MGRLNKDLSRDIKFYVTLFLGFALLLIGCFIEPTGQISSSVLIGSGMILTISAGLIGVDLANIIREFRLLQAGVLVDSVDEKK